VEQRFGNLYVFTAIAAAEIVDITDFSIFEDMQDAAGMVVDVKPIAYLSTIPVNRDRRVVEKIRHAITDPMLHFHEAYRFSELPSATPSQRIAAVGRAGSIVPHALGNSVELTSASDRLPFAGVAGELDGSPPTKGGLENLPV
jgi:hypothetical protein